MLDATTEFRKNGFNDQDAATLGTLAAKFQNVSDEAITAGDSASFIISQMIAFGVEADNASSIIDSVNEVANQFSVSSGDLSKALGNVASTAGAMGNSMEETLGMVTAITEQTRNASKASRSLNTIFSRLSQVTDANSDTGQKLTDIYDGLNIALYDNEGQMRSSYDILSDLSTKWDSLSKNQQNYIALTSAGSNQLNAFLALMNNFGHATEATETAINSAGSATKENERYMESLQAQVQALKAEFQEFATNILSSDLVKGFLQAGTSILKFANTDLGQAISKILLFNLTVNGISGILDLFGANISKVLNPMGGLNTIFEKASGIFAKFASGATEAGAASSGLGGIISQLGSSFSGLSSGASTTVSAIKGIVGAISALPLPVKIAVAAIAGLIAIYNKLHVSDKELTQSIADKETTINNTKSQIDEYNSTLESNKQRIEEINSLKGTSDWNNSLQTEADTLERQNQLVERQIQLQEQKLKIEQAALWKDQSEQFERTYGDKMRYTTKQQNVRGEEVSVTLTGEEAYKKKLSDLQVTIHKFTQTQNLDFKDAAVEAEDSILGIVTELEDYKSAAEAAGDTTKAKYIQSLIDMAEAADSVDGSTIKEVFEGTTEGEASVEEQTSKLVSKLKELGDISIKPKDADSMGEWLQSLSDDTLTKLQDMLQLSGQNAEGLAAILSGMSGADAINYITEAYKEYYGTIDDATQATNEFNEALNTNFAEGIENQLTMIDYIQKSQSEGITNAKAYKAALEGVYGTADKNLIKMADSIAKSNTEFNKTGTIIGNYKSYFAEGVDGVSKFFGQLETISKSTSEDLQGLVSMTGSIETGDLEVTIDDFGELADKLGLSETGLKSLVDYMQAYGDINIGESIDGTTANLQKLADGLDVVNDKFKTLIGSKDTDVFGGSLGTGEVKINLSTDEAKQKAEDFVNTVNEQTAEITGTQIDFDVNAKDAEAQLENVYNYVQNLQKYIDDSGNWDFSSVTDKLKDVNDITVDGNKIQIEGGEEAGEKLKQAILNGVNEDSAEGQTLLANFFNNVDVSGADDAAQKVVDALKNSINGKLNTTEIAVEGAFKTTANNMGLVVTSADNATDAVNKTGQAVDQANQKNLNGLKGSVDSTKGSVDSLNSSLSSVSSYVSKLQNKKIKVTVTYTETNKPNTVGGTVTVHKAVGQIPAYANGKNLDGTTSMRMQSSGNALVGEEGAEFRITKDGKKELLGKYGAEIAHVDKGDTIIPADVTEMIRKGQLEGYAKGKSGSGKTSVSASLMAKPTGSFKLSDIKSKYDGKQIVSNNKLTSSFGSTTKATSSNTKATNANTSAKSANADATDELTDAQKSQKEAFEEANDVAEHHIFLAEKNGASYEKLIKMNRDYQKQIQQQADWWRSQGFNNDSEEIRKLQKLWWQVEDDITSYQKKAFDERYQESKDYIDDRNDLEDWGADSEIEAWHRVEAWMDEWYKNGLISYDYYLEKRKEATKKAAEAEKKAWKEAKEAEKKRLEDWQDVYEDLFDLVADKAQEEIDKLKEERDTVEKYWDDKIDALEKANDELDDQIEKEEALDALARARSTKVMVYQDGRFQYINDIDEVSEAKANLDKIERDQALEREKENLEKQKEAALKAIDDQIDAWEKYKDEWSDVVSEYEKEQKRLNVLQKLGVDLEAENWKERLGNLEDYVSQYKKYMQELTKINAELEAEKDITVDSNKVSSGASAGGAIGSVIGTATGGVLGGAIGTIIGTATGALKGTGSGSSSSKGSSSSSSSNSVISSDKGYTITTNKGTSFVNSAPSGSTMVGGDGSKWTKNKDGSTTIKTKDGTTHTVKATSKRASGTKYAPRGIALTGEEGAELQVLNQGDGIIPHDLTSNLWEWGETKPSDIVSAFANVQKDQSGVTICIENFNPSLPNVVDGEGFANYLKNNFWRNVVQYKTTMGRA
nr:MAG TPA: minor tail protein [Caudoviricetes sp.]